MTTQGIISHVLKVVEEGSAILVVSSVNANQSLWQNVSVRVPLLAVENSQPTGWPPIVGINATSIMCPMSWRERTRKHEDEANDLQILLGPTCEHWCYHASGGSRMYT